MTCLCRLDDDGGGRAAQLWGQREKSGFEQTGESFDSGVEDQLRFAPRERLITFTRCSVPLERRALMDSYVVPQV